MESIEEKHSDLPLLEIITPHTVTGEEAETVTPPTCFKSKTTRTTFDKADNDAAAIDPPSIVTPESTPSKESKNAVASDAEFSSFNMSFNISKPVNIYQDSTVEITEK